MINRVLEKCNLVFTKQNKYKILSQLLVNTMYRLKLNIFKWIKNIKSPIIHYHAICWNEEVMLPYMFDHYKDFVSYFYIYDNYSNDDTEDIVNKHNHTKIIKYGSKDKLNDEEYLKIKNNVWKISRGKADYVIVCDIDEFLFSANIKTIMQNGINEGYSFFIPDGFEMYSNSTPVYSHKVLLTESIKTGLFSEMYSKPILFDPHKIVEINYLPGAHQAFPVGIVKTYRSSDLKLLHYKNIGLEYVLNRIRQYRNRLSEVNIEKGYGIEYLNEDKKIIQEFNENLEKSKIVI